MLSIKAKRGISIVELLLAVGLLALLFGLGILNFRNSRERATTRGVAQLVTEELRLARQTALSVGHPVAVAIPSAGGTSAHSSSLYVLEGEVQPKVARVANYGQEFEGASLFVGQYPLDTSALNDPSAGNSVTPIPVKGEFSLADWQPPNPDDQLFVFTPAGTVFTNGLTHFDGHYHIVVARGVTYAGSPGVLSQVGAPETITVSPSGSVSWERGLRAADGSVNQTIPFTSLAGAPPPAVSGPGSLAPVYASIDYQPKANPSVVAPGADTALDRNDFLTLTVKATEPEGDQLFCRWTSTGGALSAGGWVPMRWDRDESVWVAERQWRPDPAGAAGAITTLHCQVKDESGIFAADIAAATLDIETTVRGRIAYHANPDGNFDIFLMNGDGSGSIQLTFDPGDDLFPDLSRDGGRIAFTSNRTGEFVNYVMNSDGTDVRALPKVYPGNTHFPVISPDGTQIIYALDESIDPHFHIDTANVDGSNSTHIIPIPNIGSMAFTPDGQQVVFSFNDVSNVDPPIHVGILDFPGGGNFTTLVTGTLASPAVQPSVSPAGELIYQRDGDLWKTDLSGNPGSVIQSGGISNARWSADGTRIVYTKGGMLFSVDASGGDLEQLTDFPADGASWSF